MTETKCNIFGRVWFLNTEKKHIQIGTVYATKQDFLFTNVAPIRNITEIVLLGFFVNTAPLFHPTLLPLIFS